MFRRVIPLTLILGLALFAGQRARAQDAPIKFKGKIEKVLSPGIFKVVDDQKQGYVVKLDLDPASKTASRVAVTGTCAPDALAGKYVEFKAQVDPKGVVQGELADLKVFAPNDTNRLGMFAEGGPDAKIDPKTGGAYLVRALVRNCKANQLQGTAGDKTIKATLAANAKIAVEFNDYAVAQAGDELEVKVGRLYEDMPAAAPAAAPPDGKVGFQPPATPPPVKSKKGKTQPAEPAVKDKRVLGDQVIITLTDPIGAKKTTKKAGSK